ncbi:zinc-binding protein [Candidatus Shapirobacteria bacterium CG10_big_fil_rev_8_21_14_0_10_40_9]|uniref:Zinc-binding protein n=1 Tax=Candidatus Shapirobacteria bacterium CG10_big_fil_rev_8_21_14_0_10_40_9 TaxID=1974888 RepID=A0A2M8L3P4_9BACT|nr:MAG: zinc-binding protein [Candidatus Shapirobacteria bacterium CG10_big_fil_rev_8_21_14_0_10_40_9]
MPDKDKQVTDKPVKETKAEEVKTEEPKVEEPTSSPTAPTDDTTTPAGTDQLGRQLYDVKCAKCGKQTQVPFKPSGDRPVYCRDCYMEQRKGGIGRGPRG